MPRGAALGALAFAALAAAEPMLDFAGCRKLLVDAGAKYTYRGTRHNGHAHYTCTGAGCLQEQPAGVAAVLVFYTPLNGWQFAACPSRAIELKQLGLCRDVLLRLPAGSPCGPCLLYTSPSPRD